MKIFHCRFEEGRTTILTLKDSNILDNKEDTLVNVNLVDAETVEKVNFLLHYHHFAVYLSCKCTQKTVTHTLVVICTVITDYMILFIESQAKIEED